MFLFHNFCKVSKSIPLCTVSCGSDKAHLLLKEVLDTSFNQNPKNPFY